MSISQPASQTDTNTGSVSLEAVFCSVVQVEDKSYLNLVPPFLEVLFRFSQAKSAAEHY